MVQLPPGTFVMGASPGEEAHERVPEHMRRRAEPQVRITFDYRFAIGKYEVTRAEFAAFVNATGYKADSPCWTNGPAGEWGPSPGLSWRNPGFAQSDRHPVVCVTWDDARAYTDWLRRETSYDYRLASEAEWEYAVRAGSPEARYWGSSITDACRHGNFADVTTARAMKWSAKRDIFDCTDGYAHTAPVGQFAPNAFGLHDMLGNVLEWVMDCWNSTYAGAPVNGPPRLDGDCSSLQRGGGWLNEPESVRAATRTRADAGGGSVNLGFRVARVTRQILSHDGPVEHPPATILAQE
jgi:formylglycine-generating enzyme required for sulfatase activity